MKCVSLAEIILLLQPNVCIYVLQTSIKFSFFGSHGLLNLTKCVSLAEIILLLLPLQLAQFHLLDLNLVLDFLTFLLRLRIRCCCADDTPNQCWDSKGESASGRVNNGPCSGPTPETTRGGNFLLQFVPKPFNV